jgi:hypothetical protein
MTFNINSIFVVSWQTVIDIYDPYGLKNKLPIGLFYHPSIPYRIYSNRDPITKAISLTFNYAPSLLIAVEVFNSKIEFKHIKYGFNIKPFYTFSHELGHAFVYSSLLNLTNMFPLIFPYDPNIYMAYYDQEPYADIFAQSVIFEVYNSFFKMLLNFQW